MKKLSFILLSAISLFNLVSCDKKSKGTNCPAKQCDYGINPATCECNPNPNDTTTNPVDTGTIQPLKSKFGNGSNGTVDTTVNWAIGKDIDFWRSNSYAKLKEVFSPGHDYTVLTYEVEIDDVLKGTLNTPQDITTNVTYINESSNPSTSIDNHRMNYSFYMLDVDSNLSLNITDVRIITSVPLYYFFYPTTNGLVIYNQSNYTFNFPKEACITQGILTNSSLYDEFNMKMQILNFTPTDKRMYVSIYIKYDNVKYVIRTELKL